MFKCFLWVKVCFPVLPYFGYFLIMHPECVAFKWKRNTSTATSESFTVVNWTYWCFKCNVIDRLPQGCTHFCQIVYNQWIILLNVHFLSSRATKFKQLWIMSRFSPWTSKEKPPQTAMLHLEQTRSLLLCLTTWNCQGQEESTQLSHKEGIFIPDIAEEWQLEY